MHSQERTFQYAEFTNTLYEVEILKLKSVLTSQYRLVGADVQNEIVMRKYFTNIDYMLFLNLRLTVLCSIGPKAQW